MNKDLALLFELQTIDSGLADRRRQLASLDDGTQARAAAAEAAKKLKEAEDKRHATRTARRDKELHLASTEEERQEKHDRCYGGRVTDPKELSALERKIEELTRLQGKLEEEILMLLDHVEAQEEEVRKLSTEVGRLKARAEDLEAHFRMDTERLTREIEELEARRKELVPQISPAMLKTYEHLRERLKGVAVAAVVDYTCQACHTAVPRDQADRILISDTPIRCESCGRILWIPSAKPDQA